MRGSEVWGEGAFGHFSSLASYTWCVKIGSELEIRSRGKREKIRNAREARFQNKFPRGRVRDTGETHDPNVASEEGKSTKDRPLPDASST